tara:strand:- start:230 stop:430 length:201 start_codon:yes stop_codon:yes gene_type:complete
MMYRNQAGKMGAMSSQPAKRKMAMTVDPIERLNQKMAGRTQGKSLEGLAPGLRKKRKSIIASYGMM